MVQIGIDIGGTFTDAVMLDSDGNTWQAKVPTSPTDLRRCFFGAVDALVCQLDDAVEIERIMHGTTVATNIMVQRNGARVGLLTTAGFADTIHIMQGHGYTVGLPDDVITRVQEIDKPVPIVPKSNIREIHERVDVRGEVVVDLNEARARVAIQELAALGVESFAICLLWSFRNDLHERRLRRLVEEIVPGAYITLSSEISPKSGEYVRTVTTAINAYTGPATSRYIHGLEEELAGRQGSTGLSILQCGGGLISPDEAVRSPVTLIGSGPVGGTIASRALGSQLGFENVLATDMGGTSFDIGLVVDGEPVRAARAVVDQYEYNVPTVDIRSIGSGGGSLVWVDPTSKAMRVGPLSAGAEPGPACYGNGDRPTITDCDLLVGYLDPDYFLGGKLRLDPDRAADALRRHVAEPLGMSVIEAARGALQIVDHQMADLIRQVTVGSGYDPRDFAVFAFGGAGPTHAPVFARELNAKSVVVPCGPLASLWSAYGAVSSDVLLVLERSQVQSAPFDHLALESAFGELEAEARRRLEAANVGGAEVEIRRQVDLKYGVQVHVVDVPVAARLDAGSSERIVADFSTRYETLFGKGTAYTAAGVDMTSVRVEAIVRLARPHDVRGLQRMAPGTDVSKERPIYFDGAEPTGTAVLTEGALAPGTVVEGPAVIELPVTTIPIAPGQRATVDPSGSLILGL
jgi:N-methylhydantoinase A